MRKLAVIIAFLGFVIMIGTAGNADADIINFIEVVRNMLLGMSMFVFGILANEYLKTHRIRFYNKRVLVLKRKVKNTGRVKANIKNGKNIAFDCVR